MTLSRSARAKSRISGALGHKACRDNRSVLYHRVPRLFEALALARGDGRLLKTLGTLNSLSPMTGACRFSIGPNGASFWRSLTIAMLAHRLSSQAKSPSNTGTRSSAIPLSVTQSWTASFTMLTAFNSPEKACENRMPAIKLLTSPQTPEPTTMSVEAAAHDRAKYLLTIKRNERSPSREIAAHDQRNAQLGITRSSLHRRFQRHGISGLPETQTINPPKGVRDFPLDIARRALRVRGLLEAQGVFAVSGRRIAHTYRWKCLSPLTRM